MVRGCGGCCPLLPRWGEHCGLDAISSVWLEISRCMLLVQDDKALLYSWPLYVQILTSHRYSFLAARLGLQYIRVVWL